MLQIYCPMFLWRKPSLSDTEFKLFFHVKNYPTEILSECELEAVLMLLKLNPDSRSEISELFTSNWFLQ